MPGRRIARGDNAVGYAHPSRRADGQYRHTPVEPGLLSDLGQVVGTGLEHCHPPGQELVAGEVAVVVGVRGRRCHMVGVHQVDDVTQPDGGLRVVEGEPVALGEHPAG